jgi:hypothetical protein
MKSEVRLLVYLLFSLFNINLAINLKHTKFLDPDNAYRLFVCKSLNNKKLFLTFKPSNKSNRYRCKRVSSKKVKEYLNITPKKIKEIHRHKRQNSKKVHKLEIKSSVLYINILSKYLDNYICYSIYKQFKEFKCIQNLNRCKRIFKENNFQIYSSVDVINIFKKLSKVISHQKDLRQFKTTVLILNVGNQDLDWAHYIFDTLHKKVKIFNDFDVVSFKSQGRMYLYRFSSRFYRIQLSNLKMNENSLKRKKKENIIKYKKRYVKIRKIMRDAHSKTRDTIVRNKLNKIKNKITICKAYDILFNHFSEMEYKKYRLLYYLDPFIDIQFGKKQIRVHYINRLITFTNRNKKRTNLINNLNLKNSNNTYTSYINGLMTKSDGRNITIQGPKFENTGRKNMTNYRVNKKNPKEMMPNKEEYDSLEHAALDSIQKKNCRNKNKSNKFSNKTSESIIKENPLLDENDDSISEKKILSEKNLNKEGINTTSQANLNDSQVSKKLKVKRAKNSFLETEFNEISVSDNDNELTAPEKIIYKNGKYNDREDFLNSMLNYKVKPSNRRKVFNLDEKKSLKLFQDPQDYYEKKFEELDDINKTFSDT